jgi:hypothetical protein
MTDASEFEMIARYSFDDKDRYFSLYSASTSETFIMTLSGRPINRIQNAFSGVKCAFLVERSAEDEIDVYSSSLKHCGSGADYDVYGPYFEVKINKGGGSINRTIDASGPEGYKYVDFSYDDVKGNQGPNLIINKHTMLQDNVKLHSVYLSELVWSVQPERNIGVELIWRYHVFSNF